MLTLSRELLAAVVAHAQADHPVEACGVLVAPEHADAPTRVEPLPNLAQSAHRFEIGVPRLVELFRDLEARGERVAAWYHSHTSTPPEPSSTDLAYADPAVLHLIVSTEAEPITRCWRIDDGGRCQPEPLTVV